jgi:Methane oxygenase PmoA
MKPFSLAAFLCLLATHFVAAAGFSFEDKPGEYLDVILDGKIAARYMYAYDKSSPAKLHDTYKPYLHIFDAEGKAPITKGPGGTFTHHRGIFIGWNKIGLNGKNYDRWHMKGGEMVHQRFLNQKADADHATFTSVVQWNDEKNQAIVSEERTMTIRRAPAPARLLVDFATKLSAPSGDITLDGDPEHSGVQYRPAEEVVLKDTLYFFPKEGANTRKDRDYPWVGETYTLNGKHYSIVELNHPSNPKGTMFSAYRDYGRFGAFFKTKIPSGETLNLNYEFLIADGDMPQPEFVQKLWDTFAGQKEPTATPKVSEIPAEKSAEPKKAAPKKPQKT